MQQIDAGHQMRAKDVLVVDEAGMVGTRQLACLVDYAVAAKVKVVLVGDPRQLPEIDAGGVLGGLAKHVRVLSLRENRRQVEEWEKVALGDLRSGSVEHALEQYEAHGRITWAPRLVGVRTAVVDAWAVARRNGEDSIMLASRREDVRALNKLARESGVAELSGPALAVSNDEFRTGDTVMTVRNDRRVGVRKRRPRHRHRCPRAACAAPRSRSDTSCGIPRSRPRHPWLRHDRPQGTGPHLRPLVRARHR